MAHTCLYTLLVRRHLRYDRRLPSEVSEVPSFCWAVGAEESREVQHDCGVESKCRYNIMMNIVTSRLSYVGKRYFTFIIAQKVCVCLCMCTCESKCACARTCTCMCTCTCACACA